MRSFMSSVAGRATSACAAFLIAGAASAGAQTFTENFNTTTADFNTRFATPNDDPVILPTSGLSGTGAIGRSTGGASYDYYNTSIGQFTAANQSTTASFYFFGATNGGAGTNDFLGFTTNITQGNPASAGSNPSAGVKAQIQNNPQVNGAYSNSSNRIETRNLGSAAVGTADTDTFVLPLDAGATGRRWFFQTLTLTYNGGDSFTIGTSLFDSDNTGVVGALLDETEITRTGLTSLVNQDIFAGYQLFSAGGSPIRGELGDNFSVTAIPEPSAATTLLGGAGLLLGFRRRRRNPR